MIDLDQYRKNAERHDMCEEYYAKWDDCHNNKQLMDMAHGAAAVDFLCYSIAQGWGIDPEYFADRFKHFLNGKYISRQNGYTSKMYCRFKGKITANTTLVTLIDCEVDDLFVPLYGICEIYCTGKCKIKVSGAGRAVFICYGNPGDIIIDGSCMSMKRINKKERDRNE